MPERRFFGVDADQREIEVTDDFIELCWGGVSWQRISYGSLLRVWYEPAHALTRLKIKNSRAKTGPVWLSVAWHTNHDAEAFYNAASTLVNRATREATAQRLATA